MTIFLLYGCWSTLPTEVAAQSSLTIEGGKIDEQFESCEEIACSNRQYCCQFQDTFYLQQASYYCLSDGLTQGQDAGLY